MKIDYSKDNITVTARSDPTGKEELICGLLVVITKAELIDTTAEGYSIYRILEIDAKAGGALK